VYLFASFKVGKRAPRNPWGGSSLEWQAPTPPPLYNFEKPPILHELYNYDDLVEVEEDVWERRSPIETEAEPVPGDAHAHARPESTPAKPVDEATALPGKAEQTDEPKAATAVEPPDSTEAETKPERSPIVGKPEGDK
jgi:heme/copper-type cytochrome/quinol oxidase subunit 1